MATESSRNQVLLRLPPDVLEVLKAAAYARGGNNVQSLLRDAAQTWANELRDDEDVQLALKARKLGTSKRARRK